MARVNVEQKALTDPRFDLLGRFLQSNRHDALGRMILVWNECQERNAYVLPERLVGAIMGDREGASWVVEADLATWIDDNNVRIKGTEGRVEWLAVKRERAKSNGRKGGRPPNQSVTDVGSTPVSSGLQPETPPAPAPALNTPLPPKGGSDRPTGKKNPEACPAFARFWLAYPRKVGKPKAAAAFAKHAPDDVLLARILDAIERQAKSDQWLRDGGQFIPHPATWLNNRRWEDEGPTPTATPPPAADRIRKTQEHLARLMTGPNAPPMTLSYGPIAVTTPNA